MENYNSKRLAEQARDARLANEDLGNDENNQPRRPIKEHKVYKDMMKRFMSKKAYDDEEYGPWQYGYHRHKKATDISFEDGDENEKEKEGYYPVDGENDGLDERGRWYHDSEYGYPYEYDPRYHGRHPYNYDKYNTDVGSGNFRDSGDDRRKKEAEEKKGDGSAEKKDEGSAANKDEGSAAKKDEGSATKKDEGKANGLPAELDPNFGKK